MTVGRMAKHAIMVYSRYSRCSTGPRFRYPFSSGSCRLNGDLRVYAMRYSGSGCGACYGGTPTPLDNTRPENTPTAANSTLAAAGTPSSFFFSGRDLSSNNKTFGIDWVNAYSFARTRRATTDLHCINSFWYAGSYAFFVVCLLMGHEVFAPRILLA